jgi:hypothetical protein
MARRALLTVYSAAALLLLLSAAATATSPIRVPFQIDETFRSRFLTNNCGFPVFVHMEGTGMITLYYDKSGALIRELDMFANGLMSTYFSPVELGGTGKFFTEVLRSPTVILYPEGADVGDPAIVIMHGVQRTSGPGNARNVGREVDEALIIELTPEGAPIGAIVGTISQTGQFDVTSVVQARCALLGDP